MIALRRRISSVSAFCAMVLALCVLPASSHAAPASAFPQTLDHFIHRGFNTNDGLPADGTTLVAQSADGLVWVAVEGGLMTFDGTVFRPFAALPGEHLTTDDIYKMVAPTTGGLWVEYQGGGFDFIKNGHVSNYPQSANAADAVNYLFEAGPGEIWAVAGGTRFVRFNGHGWEPAPGGDAPVKVRAVRADSHHNLWLLGTTDGKLFRRGVGEKDFRDMHVSVPEGFSVSVPTNHTLFVGSSTQRVFRFRVEDEKIVSCGPPLPGLADSVVADGNGGAWMSTVTDGVHYFPSIDAMCPSPPTVASDFVSLGNKTTGAVGDIAIMGMVDREGNFWATSEGGLDRYTRSAFSRVGFPSAISMATIAAGTDGSLWVGSETQNVFYYAKGATAATATTAGQGAMALSAGSRGDLVLAAGRNGVWQLAPGEPHAVATLPPTPGRDHPEAVYKDDDGTVWLAYDQRTFVRAADQWRALDVPGRTKAIYGDGAGGVWLALWDPDTVSVWSNGTQRLLTHKDGLDVGRVKVVMAGLGGVWIGGERGVQFRKDGFHRLDVAGSAQPVRVTGLVFDDSGSLWIHAANGLYRVDARDLASFASGRTTPVPVTVLTNDDGLPGHASQARSLPSLVKGGDGRLWVEGGTSVSWIDPHDVPRRPLPSAPIILGMSVEGRRLDVVQAPTLPRNERSPLISYTAPATTDASRLRFQTRLAGFDDGWVDQGARREVGYTRIGAGHYVFSVRVSTDGVTWTRDPPQLAFSVEPFFYETWWFKTACAGLALFLLWLGARWEVRRAVHRYQARTQIRIQEREAIARDLHDTLLQSNLSLVLRLDILSRNAADPAMQDSLRSLTESANRAVTEGRQRLAALRNADDDAASLPARLEKLGRERGEEAGMHFSLQVEGKPGVLDLEASDELRLLLSEAMINAFRHSGADAVRVTLQFGRRQLRASVEDDGHGFPPGTSTHGQKGHFGLPGMAERAAKLGARFDIETLLPTGTRVSVDVPARRLYATYAWNFPLRRHPK